MHPFVNNDPTDSLTDNIISRHFNQSLSSELFNLHPQIKPIGRPNDQPNCQPNGQSSGQPNGQSSGQPNSQLNGQPNNQLNGRPNCQPNGQPNGQLNGPPDSYTNQNNQQNGQPNLPSNEFSQNYSSEHQSNQINRTNQNYESDYQLSQAYRNETLLEETIFNKHDKIRQLIDDCEMMNNNNINNFVNYSSEDLRRPLDTAHHGKGDHHFDAKLASSNKCNCKCHCANHKKRNPFHLTNKLLHSLAKIKLNSSTTQKSSAETKRSNHQPSEDYNSFAPSLSNYSLSSSSSISSQTVSVSSYSSAPDNYGQSLASSNLATVLKRPVRKPPLPPPPVREDHSIARCKPPAELPASALQSDRFDKPISRASDEHSAQNDHSNQDDLPAKRSSSDENHYERVITKSFENLLIGDIKDSLGQRISLDDRLKERPISSLFGRSELFAKELLDQEESIYETIGSDYDLMDEESFKDCFGSKNADEEDLYQDIDLLDEDIYESLPNEFNEETKKSETVVYANDATCAPPKACESELDRKLRKQQKALDKKREMRAEKLRKKFNLLGNEVPLMSGIVKKSQNGNSLNLTVNEGEVVLILRIHDNPSGMWLAKDERSKVGYISNQLVEVDLENYKSLMNVPKIF